MQVCDDASIHLLNYHSVKTNSISGCTVQSETRVYLCRRWCHKVIDSKDEWVPLTPRCLSESLCSVGLEPSPVHSFLLPQLDGLCFGHRIDKAPGAPGFINAIPVGLLNIAQMHTHTFTHTLPCGAALFRMCSAVCWECWSVHVVYVTRFSVGVYCRIQLCESKYNCSFMRWHSTFTTNNFNWKNPI